MRGILFFKSKLAALLVGMTAMLAVPVVGAIAISYTILPDIGVFSNGQKTTVWVYGILCLLSVVYAYLANWMFLNEVWREHALPGYKWAKYSIGLIILPVIGSFFMLYLYFKPSFKVGGTVKRLSSILIISTIVDVVVLTILFFEKAGLEWILLIAGIMCVLHYILLIIMACKLAKYPIGRPAKIIITILLVSLFGAVAFMASSSWIIDSKIAKAKKELADIYGRPMTSDAVKELYYHGLEPNYKKFKKILPCNPKDKTDLIALPRFPEKLECYYMSSFIANNKLDVQLNEWVKSKETFFKDFDRIIKNEKYLKMPESFRDYDGMLLGILLSELCPLRHWGRADRARIIVAVNNKNIKEALRLLQQMRRIRDYALDDNFVISILVGMAIEAIRIKAIKPIIESNKMTNSQIKNIIKELEVDRKGWKKLYSTAMYGDAVSFINAIEMCVNEVERDLCFWNINSLSIFPEKIADKYFKSNKHVRKFLSAPTYWMCSRDLLYTIKFHVAQAKIPPPKDLLKKIRTNIPDYAILSKFSISDISRFWEKIQMIQTQQSAAITALRIELYRRKYKKLPEKLNDLVPGFAEKVPIDLLSGKSLKYIHGEITLLLTDARIKYSEGDGKVPVKINGYRIYCVGFNKKDEQGFQGSIKNKYYDDIGFSVIESVP